MQTEVYRAILVFLFVETDVGKKNEAILKIVVEFTPRVHKITTRHILYAYAPPSRLLSVFYFT